MEEDRQEQKTHQQHPIPQNVMGVEFKLVGGLTLRQFAFLAGFIIVAWITYSSGLPTIIKTPLAATIAIFGAFISLVPIQDRSADIWVKNFLLAISSPTERVWKKGSANLDIFFELREAKSAITLQKEGGPPKDRSQLTQYLRNAQDDEITPMDLAEKEFLKSVAFLQDDVVLPSGMQPTITKATVETEDTGGSVVREDVDVTPTLASEVNYSQEKVIAIPGVGKQPKFVTPIQNTRTGRRIRLVRPGEIGLSVMGEKKIASAVNIVQKQAEDLASKVEEVGKKIERAQETTRVTPAPVAEVKILPVLPETPPKTNSVREVPPLPTPAKTEILQKPQIRVSPEEIAVPQAKAVEPQAAAVEAPVVENLGEQASPQTLAQPVQTPSKQEEDKQFDTGKIAYLSEELAKLKEEKQKLVDDLEKQKKARMEA